MRLSAYEFTTGENLRTFEFLSKGPKGSIIKAVQFQPLGAANIYNLAFGDKNSETGEIDDKVVTDNGDTEKVLATVVAVVYVFAEQFPDAWIYVTGSTTARTRLYRMGINKYFDMATIDFEILGEYQTIWESYEFGKDYRAFAVRKKNSKFDL